MTDESYIEQRVGKRNPFQVPEGYFDHFASQMMRQLDEATSVPRAKRVWLRPAFMAVAASVCALVICAAVYLWQPDATQPSSTMMAQQELSDDSFDEAADYMMLDNSDIYACLADY